MDEFWQDLSSGDIQFRDKWQFELKSEFYPRSKKTFSVYTQEFYIFIPNALQINSETYSKEQFYRNQTTLIRFKTPEFTLSELTDTENRLSPLNKTKNLLKNNFRVELIEDELKLLGNIFRSALRSSVLKILSAPQLDSEEIEKFCNEIKYFRTAFLSLEESCKESKLWISFEFLDEFISNSIDYYLTGFLNEARQPPFYLNSTLDENICKIIVEEQKHREHTYLESKEEVLYRKGLLKKYVIDALLLDTNRASIQQKYGHYIGAISAGAAMLIYVMLFVWQGQGFLINSQPFIFLTVIAYVLKDRVKEGLKNISYERALRWFSDYSTEIRSPNKERILGELKESFTFIDEASLPDEIRTSRDKEFHNIFESFKRPEHVIYIKKSVKMYPQGLQERRKALTMTFRYNIQDFLSKASDSYHNFLSLDSTDNALIRTRLHKVYHINIILKNTFEGTQGRTSSELKKFRIIVDKNNINHIEQIKVKNALKPV